MKNWPKVSIIILNWNTYEETIECLKSLQKITYPNYEIIVVDNGSTNNSLRVLKEWKESKITLISTGKNLGASGGRNVGINYTMGNKTDYILTLDNDTVVSPDFLEPLVKIGESDKRIGITGSKIYYYDKPTKIYAAGGKVNWWKGGGYNSGMNRSNKKKYNKIRERNFLTGCSLLIKRKVIEELGKLDEDYFFWGGEDLDYCVRAKRKGYQLVYVPKSIVWHKVDMSVRKEPGRFLYHFYRSKILFMKKRSPLFFKIIFFFNFKIYLQFLKMKWWLKKRPLFLSAIRKADKEFKWRNYF